MIVDFPEIKKLFRKIENQALRQNVNAKAIIDSMARKKIMHEGDKMGMLHEDGSHPVNEFKRIESTLSISDEEMRTLSPEDMLSKISTLGEEIAGQMERGILRTIEEATEAAGNVMAGNPELGPGSILDALDKICVNFEDDDRSKPIMPTIFAGPEAADALLEKEKQLSVEERKFNERRHEAIMDRKYEEHMSDVASRKIID